MSLLFDPDRTGVDHVLHPTDLSEASERAFHHALAIAIRRGAQFTLLHAVGRRATDNWEGFPSVRAKLSEWRKAGTTAELEDRIRRASVSKVEMHIRDPTAASMRYIRRNPVDMIVLATADRSRLSRLIRPSRAQRLAAESKLYTLFVPEGGQGFVDPRTGCVTLRRILVPIHPETDPRSAMLRAVQSAVLLDDPSLEITLLHVGEGEEDVLVDLPQLPFCRWHVVRRRGDVVGGILELAEEIRADAIYMSTAWTRSGFGRPEGGVTEAVLGDAPCPVAAVPVKQGGVG